MEPTTASLSSPQRSATEGAMDGQSDGQADAIQFNTHSFDSAATRVPASESSTTAEDMPPFARARTNSRGHADANEWDASKVPPSRFQKRQGSIYAVPASRDGHVQKNYEAAAQFHKQHAKRFSLSKVKDKVVDRVDGAHHNKDEGRGAPVAV